MPKRTLRSTIDFGGISQENLVANLNNLEKAKFTWIQPPDQRIYEYVRSYFEQRMELPSGQTVLDYFSSADDTETIERLKEISAAPAYIRTNFLQLVTNLKEDEQRAKAVGLLKGVAIQHGH
jgi:hypothetical protein